MRMTLKEQLGQKEGQLTSYREDNARLQQEIVKLNCRNEDLLSKTEELSKLVEHYRRNRVIAEARMAGFIEATNLFIKGGKAGPDGQN